MDITTVSSPGRRHPSDRGERGPAQHGAESPPAPGLTEHRHASGRVCGLRCQGSHMPCSEEVCSYTFRPNQVCPTPATLMRCHWAVSGDLQAQAAAGQDPGKQTPPPTGPRPPRRSHAPHAGATPTTEAATAPKGRTGRKAFLQT